jgi:hypothetical protein
MYVLNSSRLDGYGASACSATVVHLRPHGWHCSEFAASHRYATFYQVATLDFCHRHPRASRRTSPQNVLIVWFGSHADGVSAPVVAFRWTLVRRATDESAVRIPGTPNQLRCPGGHPLLP